MLDDFFYNVDKATRMRDTIKKSQRVGLLFYIFTFTLFGFNLGFADTVKINFTSDDSCSIEVAKIDVGDTIEWVPRNKGHNVEFLAAPNMKSLPEKSELDAIHMVTFDLPGVYLYQCTPHGNMGMLGLIVVDNNFDNIESIGDIELSPVAKSVLQRLIRVAESSK